MDLRLSLISLLVALKRCLSPIHFYSGRAAGWVAGWEAGWLVGLVAGLV